MAVHPGPYLDAAEAFVVGVGPPPPILGFRGSYNLALISDLTKWLNGDSAAGDFLVSRLKEELEGDKGIWSDEFGGGYSGEVWRAVLVGIRFARRGGPGNMDRLGVLLRWHGAALRVRTLLAVPHRETVITTGPGARMRDYLVTGLQVPLQITLGEKVRRYGISGESGGRDQAVWFWRPDGKLESNYRQLMESPLALARESGVDPDALLDWVYGPTRERAEKIAKSPEPLKVLWETSVLRWGDASSFAAYWSEFASGDAPCAGAIQKGGALTLLQPQPIGPRAGIDTQHWGGENRQTAGVFGGELVARFVTQPGLLRPGELGPVREQRVAVALPPGAPEVSFILDSSGFRWGYHTSPPPPPVGPGNGAVREILEKFLQMRRGQVRADEMEQFIRERL